MSETANKNCVVGGSPKSPRPSRPPWWTRCLGAAVLAFLALHSLSYGLGFLADPAAGAQEFGANAPPSEAAEHLAGLVGVILVLVALTGVAAAGLLLLGRAEGAWVTLGLGIAMFSIGAYWGFIGYAWDACFYSAVGLLLIGTGAVSILSGRRATSA